MLTPTIQFLLMVLVKAKSIALGGQNDYARQVLAALKRAGLRAAADLRNEKIGYKIREATLQKVPYLLVIGEQEKAEGRVTLRSRAGDNLGSLALDDLVERLRSEAQLPAASPAATTTAATATP